LTADILIVEDDAGSREALTLLLTDEGFRDASVSNGTAALDYLGRSSLPRLIIFDLMMPDLDGWDFRDRQRRDPQLARIPVIAVSAALRIVDADMFFRKPVDVLQLLAAIRRYVPL
jgi:CheY-like chemotaxis protein